METQSIEQTPELELEGSHLQTLDERNRISIPAKLLGQIRVHFGIGDKEPVPFVISVSTRERLAVYPKPVYDRIVAELKRRDDDEAEDLLAQYRNYKESQDTDNQNRIKLPQMHAEAFELAGEVVFLGSGDFLEIVNKQTWKSQLKEALPKMRSWERAKRKQQQESGQE